MTHAAGRRRLLVLASALPPVAVVAAFLHALAWGWGRYGDVLVDTGRELELPRRILEGETLYADLRWYYGPLAPWINSTLYELFGVHVDVLAWAGAASAALLCWVLYALARRFASPWVAAAAAIAFIHLCAFPFLSAPAIFNFVLPYTFAATYGMVAASASLFFLIRFARSRAGLDLFVSLVALVLAGLAKIEAFLPALVAHATFLAAELASRRISLPRLVPWGIGAAVLASTYGLLRVAVGSRLWTENLAGVGNAGSVRYVLFTTGLMDASAAVLPMLTSAALLATVAALAFLASRLAASRIAAAVAGLLALALGATLGVQHGTWAMPIAFLLAGAATVRTFVRDPGARDERLSRLLLFAFAFAALARIPLRAGAGRYGFFLLPVPLVALAVLLTDLGGLAGRARRPAFSAVAAGLLLGLAVNGFRLSEPQRRIRSVVLEGPRGALRAFPAQSFTRGVVAHLRRYPAGTTSVVVPQGLAMSFLAGLDSAGPLFTFLPMELPGPEADRRLVREWERSPPSVAVVIPGEMTDFGSQGFGADYATAPLQYLLDRYRPVVRIGPALVFERTPASAPARPEAP